MRIIAQGNVPWPAMMCPPCHPTVHDENKSQWVVGNTTLVLSLLTFIHAAVISVAKLLRKACHGGPNWFWNVPDKEPLEGRIKRLEDDFRTLKETMSLDLKNVENDIQSDRSRIKRLETSHSGLKEDKRALHKRVTTLKKTLEHKVKVEVGEGILRQRRQPGKEWSKDEIGGGEGSS
ncbi:hypothetical protein ACN38_g2210 [Penicillium nordicum]|uniref:Uncharacterized protein n=1 Tax=Penicillium nordicum TaxID=229535 RepID=A0A0M8P7R6_9EURO|nr:hypothetical protein ACN38_g2210 [Penicillium nordicum]